jgi:hypothetical protein
MRDFPRRLIALLLLASFGPLASGGQGWHALLGDSACCSEGCIRAVEDRAATARGGLRHRHCPGEHTGAGHHHARHGAIANPSQLAVSRPGHNHDLCLICQFFAQPQKSTPVAFAPLAEQVCDHVRCADADTPRAAPTLSYRSRAPPALAQSA